MLSLVRLLVGCLDAGRSAAVTTGPRSSQSAAGLVMGSRNRLGLRRSLLAQEHGEQDIGSHLQEIAFPVLEHSRKVMPRLQVVGERDCGLGVLTKFLQVGMPAGQRLTDG